MASKGGVDEWFVAIKDQDVDKVQQLIAQAGSEFSVNASSGGLTALHIVSQKQTDANVRILELLLKHPGIDVNCTTFVLSYTPLHIACKAGHALLAAMLLQHKAIGLRVYTAGRRRTPHDLAVKSGNVELVKMLDDFVEAMVAKQKLNSTIPEMDALSPHGVLDESLAAEEDSDGPIR